MRVVSNKELKLQLFGRILRRLWFGELRHNIIKNIKINLDRTVDIWEIFKEENDANMIILYISESINVSVFVYLLKI